MIRWNAGMALLLLALGCSMPKYTVQTPAAHEASPATQSKDQTSSADGTAADSPSSEDPANPDPAKSAIPPSSEKPAATPPSNNALNGPATGTVTVSLNIVPPTPAGPYRDRGHIRSIYITDANDKYLKTIQAFAATRAIHLKRWRVLNGNTVDGATGATQITPAAGIPISVTWDLKDKAGLAMPMGSYKLWIEYAETNTPALDAGKKPSELAQVIDGTAGYEFFSVPFSLTAQGQMKTDTTNPVFKDIAVKHVP